MFKKSKFPSFLIVFMVVTALVLSLGITPLFAAANTKVEEFVTRFYTNALERQPDAAGLNSWVSQLAAKKVTGAQFASGILFSAEFTAKNKNNEEFVTVLFRTLYNREPDAAGFDSWVNLLNAGQSRQFVLAGFTNSAEFQSICTAAGIKAGQLDPAAGLPTVQASKTRLPILAMHGVEPIPSGKYELSSAAFEYLLSTLKSYGYKTVTLMDVLAYLDKGKKLPAKPIIISMDDGYQNLYINAFPLAKKYGFKFTVFLTTGLIGDNEATRRLNEFDADVRGIPARQMLIWPEIQAMSKSGMEFQSHTWGHEVVTDLDAAGIQQTLKQSKSDIESKLGKSCVFVAWPHDAFSEEAISLLAGSGYRGALRAYGGVEDLGTINLNSILRLNIDGTINPVDYASYIGLQ
jgi:peptidoglycan/xylan/chitin deacetylase (PgdA/CDA1 family)